METTKAWARECAAMLAALAALWLVWQVVFAAVLP